MLTLTAECVLDTKAILGEGPVWRAETQDLVWVDIESARVCCFNPTSGENQTWDSGEKPGWAVPAECGDLILGTSIGFVRLDLASGDLSPIIDPEQDLPNNRFNDGKVDPEGRLWAGTMGMDEAPNVGSLYRLNRNLSTDKLFDQVSISNGMAWTSDQKTYYYIDSPTRRMDVFDCDMASGTVSDRRIAFELPEGMGYPDGMCIDNEGMLWVALWQGWGVARFAPGGALLAKVEVPVECVTSCCFGGENWDELYITTSSRDLDEAGNRILCRFRTEPGATPYRLTTSTFDGDGRRTSVVTRNYDETAGAYVEADSTAMAYGPYGIVLHEAFDRDGSTWKLVERHTVTYSEEGSRAVAVQELPRSVGSGLVARVRKTLDLDPFSRPTSYLQEVYPDGASDWQPSVRYLYTYAADPRQTDVALDPTTDAFALSVAPNPSVGVFSVTLTASSPTTVEVFDALGRRVAEVRSGSVASGETRIPVDLRSLPAGVYVLRATTEAGGVVSQTATVVR